MMPPGEFIVIVLVAQLVLDILRGAVGPSWRFDVAYCALYAVAARALFVYGEYDGFAWCVLIFSAGWGVKACLAFKKSRQQMAG